MNTLPSHLFFCLRFLCTKNNYNKDVFFCVLLSNGNNASFSALGFLLRQQTWRRRVCRTENSLQNGVKVSILADLTGYTLHVVLVLCSPIELLA